MITLSATYQQTKRLVDGVNGTYQTVLTINQSVGQIAGTYSCTVGNARGESSRTVVVPGETLVFMLLLSRSFSFLQDMCQKVLLTCAIVWRTTV